MTMIGSAERVDGGRAAAGGTLGPPSSIPTAARGSR